jgi:endonuclease IV
MTTVKELRQYCKDRKINGYSRMVKDELIRQLKNTNPEDNIPPEQLNVGNDRFKIGIHIFKGNNMAESIIKARKECPLNAAQIFTHGPRNMKKVNHDYASVRSAGVGISMYVHSSYPTNPWNGKDDVFKHTLDQFSSSRDIGSKGVVLHIPKLEPDEVAKPIKTLVDALLNKGLEGQKVILEMKAMKQHATQSYESPEKINRLIDALKSEGLTFANVGICIDTAHIYAGKANIHTYEEGVKYCRDIKYPEWICLLHLNGNVYDAKKRAGDKHAIPFDHEDNVWKNIAYTNSGCKAFIEFAKNKKIDFILEVKDHHTVEQVKMFIKLVED